MRTAAWFLMMFAGTGTVQAQTPGDGVAIGGILSPALDGFSDFWFMPGIRIAVPVGARVAIDFDAGRVLGGRREHSPSLPDGISTVRADRFYTGQMRVLTARRRGDGGSTYWMIGIHHVGTRRFDRNGVLVSREPAGGGLLGFGSDQLFANGTRLAAEVGIAGPDGFRPFLVIAWQWRLH
jgi:hypothetical protein